MGKMEVTPRVDKSLELCPSDFRRIMGDELSPRWSPCEEGNALRYGHPLESRLHTATNDSESFRPPSDGRLEKSTTKRFLTLEGKRSAKRDVNEHPI